MEEVDQVVDLLARQAVVVAARVALLAARTTCPRRRVMRSCGARGPALRQAGEPAHYGVADAVAQMVRFREPVQPNPAWRPAYEKGLRKFEKLAGLRIKRH